ncbi:MAG TPA: hypothetical protein VE129_08650 [Thermoanaerobaculia bacterium]|nr:hypothetical protein [Thermoanaerobaculia bacterium]
MCLPGIPSPKHPWRIALAALCILFLLANAPLLIGLDAPNWDASSFFGPAFTLVADHARAGKLLLWNPFVDGGAPDAAQPEYGCFSPLTVGAGALFGGTERGFRAYWLGVWGLGGLGFLGLARHLGAPPWAGFVVTLGYLFSGTFTGHAQHTSWLHSFAFVPWVLWRLDVALLDRRLLPAVQAGALLGLSALAGYPAIVIQTGVLALFWAAGREWTREGDGEEPRRRSLGFSGGVLAIVAVVGAVVLLPSWFAFLRESRGYSDRSGPLPKEVAVHDNSLHPLAFTTFASPYLHVLATLYAPARWAPTDGSSAGAYAGAAIPAFAVLALCRSPRRRWLWWLAGTALLLLATSTDALPLRGWLYDLMPWERFARHGAQRKDLALFVLAVLALHGAPRAGDPGTGDSGTGDEGGRPPRESWLFLACVAGTALLALAGAVAGSASLGAQGPRPVFAVVHFVVVWGGLVAVAWFTRKIPGIPERRGAILPAALVALAVLDAAGTARLSRVLMVDRGRGREVWDRIGQERTPQLDLTKAGLRREAAPPAWTSPNPNNQNVPLKEPVFESYNSMTNRYRAATSGELLLAATAIGAERVWFASSAVVGPPGEDAFRYLVSTSRAAGAAILVVHPPVAMTARPSAAVSFEPVPAPPAPLSDLRLRSLDPALHRYRTDELELSVLAPGPGWVFVTDRWAAGWRAWVDGREVPVWGGNLLFRAVRVTAGSHRLRFLYRPAGYPHLLALSWGTLLAVAFASARPRKQGALQSQAFPGPTPTQ